MNSTQPALRVNKLQIPISKEAPSAKLKNRPARRWPQHLFFEFAV
jgi:hypothetical protein